MKCLKLNLRDLFWLVLVVGMGLGWWITVFRSRQEMSDSPHAQALTIVLRTQADRIRDAEQEVAKGDKWWFDTMERTWIVKRPFGPGYVDSRHLFDVTYLIAGKQSATWMVSTENGVVQRADHTVALEDE